MSDCPSASLVKMTSQRVSELAHACIAFAKSERLAATEPFEAKIEREIARRLSVKRKWFRPDASYGSVYRDLASDWVWAVRYHDAVALHQRAEEIARTLLLATKESDEIWVSVGDLNTISCE